MDSQVISEFKKTYIGLLPFEWEIVKLGDVYNIQQGKAISGKHRQGKEPFPFLRTSNVYWGKLELSEIDEMDFAEHERKKLELQSGDLLICEGGEIGRTAIWKNQIPNCYYQNHVFRVRAISDHVVPLFHMYWMQAALTIFGSYSGHGNKTTIPNLSKGRLSEFYIPVPHPIEQHRIATVLNAIQESIATQDDVITAAREFKRSLIKRLFTYGPGREPAETKETEIGDIPSHWEVKPVGTICKSIVPGRDKPKRFDGSIPWVTMPDIRDRSYVKQAGSGLALSEEAIAEVRAKVIPEGSVIMSCVGEFGITSVATRGMVINQQLHAFVCPDSLEPYFLSHALQLQKPYMEKIAHFTTIAYLNKDKCESIPVPLPPLDEQKRIVNDLTAVDAKIAAEEDRKTALLAFFKTMLHHLMAGQIRLLSDEGLPL